MERWLGSNVAFHIPQNEEGEQYMHESLDSHRTCPRCRAIVNEHFVNNVEHVVNNNDVIDTSNWESYEADYFAEHGVHTWEHIPFIATFEHEHPAPDDYDVV
jgi:hypothetical protein